MSAKSRVLRRLTQGPATTADLCQPEVGGIRFGARIAELRAEGHAITESRLRQGSSRYELVEVGSSAGKNRTDGGNGSRPALGQVAPSVAPTFDPTKTSPDRGVTRTINKTSTPFVSNPERSDEWAESAEMPGGESGVPAGLVKTFDQCPDFTEGGRYEVRFVEPLPSQAHEWEHVLRFTPGEITAEYWRQATPTQQAMAA